MQAASNKPYDYNTAARLGIKPQNLMGLLVVIRNEVKAQLDAEGEDASFTCSELVFRAFEISGAALTKKPAHLNSPGQLFRTDKLAYMGRLI